MYCNRNGNLATGAIYMSTQQKDNPFFSRIVSDHPNFIFFIKIKIAIKLRGLTWQTNFQYRRLFIGEVVPFHSILDSQIDELILFSFNLLNIDNTYLM